MKAFHREPGVRDSARSAMPSTARSTGSGVRAGSRPSADASRIRTHGLRDPRDPRRPGARLGDRGGDDADLPDLHLRAGGGRRSQGVRLRARRQPDADGARGVPRLARECRVRARLLVGPRGRDDDHAPRRPWPAARLRERRLRRHVPDVLPGLRAQGLRLRLHHAGRGVDQPRRPSRRAHPDRVGRVTDEPAAERRRPPRRSRRGARRRRPARGRQHVRDAVSPAAARARRGHRRALDDEVPRRPLGRRSAASPPRTTRRSRNGSASCRSRSAPSPARSTPGSCCAA